MLVPSNKDKNLPDDIAGSMGINQNGRKKGFAGGKGKNWKGFLDP